MKYNEINGTTNPWLHPASFVHRCAKLLKFSAYRNHIPTPTPISVIHTHRQASSIGVDSKANVAALTGMGAGTVSEYRNLTFLELGDSEVMFSCRKQGILA
jgi:hypothetical protein